jgi:PiT family inorganic phosphate transporter
VGENITKLTFAKGFAAQFGSAVAVLIATVMGMPISTTAVLIGAITGVGASEGRGSASVKYREVAKIIAGWVVTLPIAGAVAAAIYTALRAAHAASDDAGWDPAAYECGR